MRLQKLFFVVASMTVLLWLPHYSSAADVTLEFFYGEGCPHCENVKPTISSLEKWYPYVAYY